MIMADETKTQDQAAVEPTAAAEGEKAVAVDAESVKAAQDKNKKTDLRSGDAEPEFLTGRTSDSDDVNRSWTVQRDEPYVDEQARPGQTFVLEQLPRPEAQIAAGIDPERHAAPLPVVTRNPKDKALVPDDVVSGRI